jgi:hypothetical protein
MLGKAVEIRGILAGGSEDSVAAAAAAAAKNAGPVACPANILSSDSISNACVCRQKYVVSLGNDMYIQKNPQDLSEKFQKREYGQSIFRISRFWNYPFLGHLVIFPEALLYLNLIHV